MIALNLTEAMSYRKQVIMLGSQVFVRNQKGKYQNSMYIPYRMRYLTYFSF